ncbi:MAG TPA: hypothetical protein RMG48_10440 [Myxococcales bacterium LLY-WYZ-16_1]|jgi:hypothetical protein|nr:hypothetical protein [Myxococcales bacterium LLY-WYZ-16_1]
MAFVDLARNRLVLKAVLAGPPAVGKSTRLDQVGQVGRRAAFGSTPLGPQEVAVLPTARESGGRPVELELYEWHGPERADLRAKGLMVGLDGLIYVADAREDRWVDTRRTLEFFASQAGGSRIRRLPSMLVLGRQDEGLLTLDSVVSKLSQVTWSQRHAGPLEDAEGFLEALRLYAEVVAGRIL